VALHQLFADLLRARLQHEQPGRLPVLHRAAAAWHDEHGLADEAVAHAVAAGEMSWAAQLISGTPTRFSGASRCDRAEMVFRTGPRAGQLPARLLLAQAWMAWPWGRERGCRPA